MGGLDGLFDGWFVGEGYALAALVVRRGIGLVYLLAFVNVVLQWRPLLGERGLLPVPDVIDRMDPRRSPSLFHWRYTDGLAMGAGWIGVVGSAAVVVGLVDRLPLVAAMLVWVLLWVLYLSFVNVGQIFYGFGWESILLEAGFLATFLGTSRTAPPLLTLLLLRWLAFRVEFGAGLIKLRGDQCWRDLTCLDFHHETQPLPGPLSRRFHRLPTWVHRIETGANHVVQLVVPFGLFLPQPFAGAAAAAIILTQSWLLASGNFAWLNLVTIVATLAAVPDAWLDVLPLDVPGAMSMPTWFAVVVVAVFVGSVWLSRRPVRNMASSAQRMNASFNPFHLLGSYGAFGSVTRTRYEVVVEGTEDPPGGEVTWHEYGFRGKPGDPTRRPPQVAPYHLRLDWLMWFAALVPSPTLRHPWLPRLVDHLLEADPAVLGLIRHDPFDGRRPRAVRALRYRYDFTDAEGRRDGRWWDRERVATIIPERHHPRD